MHNPITATVAFDVDGKHHGFLKLPHSHDASAWGHVMIPISVVRNGKGPTALLTGGNHGDEYEGVIALQELAQTLAAERIQGTVIIVPAFNFPAFRAGTRTSPIDGGNLNRVFPGRANGTVTEKIADYFQQSLIPMADVVLDFHSGGRTLEFVPFALAHELDNAAQQTACHAAMQAFNAPYSVVLREIDSVGMYDSAVEDMGKVFVTTELGGGGSSTARTNTIAKRGVRNVLAHAGILDNPVELQPTIELAIPDEHSFSFSEHEGMLEPMVDLGDPIVKGAVIARIWPVERTGQPPVDYHAKINGVLCGRHFPGLIHMGDCLAVVGIPR